MNTDTDVRRRCYGYTPDGDVIDAEADAIRLTVDRILNHEFTLTAAVRQLNDAGARTVDGGQWSLPTLNRLLINPRLAGLTAKSRRSSDPAPAIITADQHHELVRRAQARRTGKYHRSGGTARLPRLLSGMLECGTCGQRLTVHANHLGPSYRCPGAHVQIQAIPLEEHVSQWAVAALAAGMEPVLPRPPSPPDQSQQWQQIRDARRARQISERQAQYAYNKLFYERASAAAEAASIPRVRLPAPAAAERWWKRATGDARRAVLSGLIQSVRVHEVRSQRGNRAVFDASRAEITLRTDLAQVS